MSVNMVRRFEDASREPLTGLTGERRREKVRQAAAALLARGARVTTLGVARELGWDRNTIEDRAELKEIVRASKAPPLTVAAVSAAIDALYGRGERVTTLGVSREVGRGRELIERSVDLHALVKAARQRRKEEMATKVRAAVADLQSRGEAVTFRSVAAALGQDEHFFERAAQALLRPIVVTSKR